MIETHTVNALMDTQFRHGAFFSTLNFINGLVAPSFLFCAGFAFAITAVRKWDDYLGLHRSFWKYLSRLSFILIVGYSLHLPFFSLRKILATTDRDAIISLFQVDILHVIAVTLTVSLFLLVVLRNKDLYITAIGIIAALMVAATATVVHLPSTGIPLWMAEYFSRAYKSEFLLFPWSSFLLAGVLAGFWFIGKDRFKTEDRFWIYAGITAAVIAVAGVKGYFTNSPGFFWSDSPEFFIVRLGIVAIIGLALLRFENPSAPSATSQNRSLILLFGRESLLVYAVHLLIVYGDRYAWSFRRLFEPHLTFAQCIGLFAILTLLMYALAFGWHSIKNWNIKAAKALQYVILGSIVLDFVLRPW